MQSKYTLLASAYCVLSIHRAKVSKDILRFTLLETNLYFSVKNREELAAILKKNYDIRNQDTLMEMLQSLEEDSYIYYPAAQILFAMYLQYGDSLTDEAVQAWALEHYGSSVVIRQTIERFHEGVVPVLSDRPDATPLVVSVGNKLRELLSDKSRLGKRHLAFFAKHRALLEATDGLFVLGFDYSRMVEIITSSGDLGYIDEELLGELLEHVGGHAERVFGSWVTFWASAVAGKLWSVEEQAVKGDTIISGNEYLSSVYGLVTSPAHPLTSFGLWEDSDMEALRTLLLPYVDLQAEAKLDEEARASVELRDRYFRKNGFDPEIEGRALLLAAELVGHPLVRLGLNYYIGEDPVVREIIFPLDDGGDTGIFWYRVHKWARRVGLTFEADEIPFMYAARHIFTNKRIYRIRRRALFFSRLEQIEWREATFSFRASGAGLIECKLGGRKFADLTFQPEHIGKTKLGELLVMSQEEVDTALADDLAALRTLFDGLIAKLS